LRPLQVSNGNTTTDMDAHDIVLSLGIPSLSLLRASVATVSGDGVNVSWRVVAADGDAHGRLEVAAAALPKGGQILAALTFEVLNASFGSVIGWAPADGLVLSAYDGVAGRTSLGYSGAVGIRGLGFILTVSLGASARWTWTNHMAKGARALLGTRLVIGSPVH